MAAKNVAPGFAILKRFGRFKTACWVLHHRGEAALVEMPPREPRERAPQDMAFHYLRRHKLRARYALLSHAHWDHSSAFGDFRRAFPEARFVGHAALADDPTLRRVLGGQDPRRAFDEVFEGPIWRGELGGEPLFVLYAPKHSWSDHLIIFRGAMITGDWYLRDLRDCNDLVPAAEKIRSIERVQHLVGQLGYGVHMLFSAHGNHLFYDVDFQEVMEESKIRH